MPTVREIKDIFASRILGDAVATLCAGIIDYAATEPPANLRVLTYRSLARIARADVTDPHLAMAVNLLVSSDRFRVLEKHFFVIEDPSQVPVPIADEEVREAYRHGVLVLPSGSAVEDVEAHLVPYFQPSALMLAARSEA